MISFFTEGGCNDLGEDLTAQAELVKERCESAGIRIEVMCPRLLKGFDADWEIWLSSMVSLHEKEVLRRTSFRWKKSWALLNNNLWKPRLIHEYLRTQDVAPGDIVAFHDINVGKYPHYLQNFELMPLMAQRYMKAHSVVLFTDLQMMLRCDAKQELIREYLGSDGGELHHLWIGSLLVKNDVTGRRFIEDWLAITSIADNRSAVTDYGDYMDYVWHSPEQATASVTYYRWKATQQEKSIKLVRLSTKRLFSERLSFNLSTLMADIMYYLRRLKRLRRYQKAMRCISQVEIKRPSSLE